LRCRNGGRRLHQRHFGAQFILCSTARRGPNSVCPAIGAAGWTGKELFNTLGSTTRGGNFQSISTKPERERTRLR
jgi:hypothetical protein